ncbi:hypothetical protein F3Y22_tig00116976pilonHSYRG00183 [Hibiscus syriacus]|uniref:IBH1-like N-terminal domain-containing protein n=1 Tax=Hibiscus syriacus TaxID=106335 RepID=A0A6A2WGC5_HIBSY|nr:hypothetical protein F3Y22_tig00116976pilonHSYRG00183 [Hibiscus syriacus]
MGLQRWSFSNKEMGILERKKAIKLSADIAMASARNGTTCWSRALIANAYSKREKHLVSNLHRWSTARGSEARRYLKGVAE